MRKRHFRWKEILTLRKHVKSIIRDSFILNPEGKRNRGGLETHREEKEIERDNIGKTGMELQEAAKDTKVWHELVEDLSSVEK